MTPEEFERSAAQAAEFIAAYWSRLQNDPVSLPVLSDAKPGDVLSSLPYEPPARGAGDALLDELFGREELDKLLPGLTHWQHPNFYAYFPANISGPAVIGELLAAGLGVQGMLWATSPACTELEMRVLDWLAGMLGLPDAFTHASGTGGGVIQGTASEAVLTALVAARHRAVCWHRARGVKPHLTLYASNQAHSSVIKAAMIAGLADGPDDRAHVRLIDVDDQLRTRPDALACAMRDDVAAGRTPCFVCATLGTTASTAIDPLREIAAAVRAHAADVPPWLHVDAAHAGAACVCPEFRPMLNGVEHADSFCVNPHKWLLTNFDCDAFFVRDKRALIDSMSITPEYLRNTASDAGAVTDFRDWHVPLGRRFRALKLWLVIRWYGVEGLRQHIRSHVALAAMFESLVRSDDRFEILAPRTLNLVCFALRANDAASKSLLDRINASGRAYLSHAVLPLESGPRFALRMAVGSPNTREEHVRETWSLIQHLADGA